MEIPQFENECEICKNKFTWGALIPNGKEKHFMCVNCYEKFTTWMLTEKMNVGVLIKDYLSETDPWEALQ